MRSTPYNAALALFVIAAIGALIYLRHDPAHVQAVAAILSFLATLGLLKVTKDYADVTREYANFTKTVSEAGRRVYLDYWLDLAKEYVPPTINSPLSLGIQVANLSANVVEIKNHIVKFADEHVMEGRTLLRSGELVRLAFPAGHLAGRSGDVPVAIKLRYVSAGMEGETNYRTFKVNIHDGQVVDISEDSGAPNAGEL